MGTKEKPFGSFAESVAADRWNAKHVPPEVVRIPDGYIAGLGRDTPHPPISHLYRGTMDNPGWPMCHNGWNRDKGQSYSIWRNQIGEKGICKTCLNRIRIGRQPIPPQGWI